MTSESPNIILIADDSPTVTGILNYLFSEHGYQVLIAADGIEAVQQCYHNLPDLIVLDVEMPRMNGYQACRLIKSDPQMQSIPIVMLTSRDLQSDRYRGLSSGADAYLVKDLEDDQLFNTVSELILLSPWKNATRLEPRKVNDDEIVLRLNNMLDHSLFLASVVHQLQEINKYVSSYKDAMTQILYLFGSVFEFVVGGILLKFRGQPSRIHLILTEGYSDLLADQMINTLINEADEEKSDDIQINNVKKSASTARIFPNTEQLTAYKIALLDSRGKSIGVIAMGATSPLKFDQNSAEVWQSFVKQSAAVMDNALLVNDLNKLNNELNSALQELRETQSQLLQSEKLASLGQLTAGIAHEMNNPLNFVSGNISHVKNYISNMMHIIDSCITQYDGNIPVYINDIIEKYEYNFVKEDIASLFKDCQEGVSRALNIINDLRIFSARDRGEMVNANLSAITDSTLNLLRYETEGKVNIIKHYDDNIEIICNPTQIGQVLMNLLTNAIHAVKDAHNNEIIVSINKEIENITIEIADTGVGISEEHITSVFQPFFTTREVGKGMGLGLSIVHGIIKAHKGEIKVESKPGKGTKFTVILPK